MPSSSVFLQPTGSPVTATRSTVLPTSSYAVPVANADVLQHADIWANDPPPKFATGPHLPSPIEAEAHGRHLVAVDQPLRASLMAKALINLHENTTQLAHDSWKATTGQPGAGVSELMAMGKIPYVLGGVAMCSLFTAAGPSPRLANMIVSVGLYMANWFLADKAVKGLYRLSTGADLGALYQSKTGRILPMFGSVAFPRVDLVTPPVYTRLAKRLGLPNPEDKATHNSLQPILKSMNTEARAMSLLLGATNAAASVGYLAQQPAWSSLLGTTSVKVFGKRQGGVFSRLGATIEHLASHIEDPLKQAFLPPASGSPITKKLGYGVFIGTLIGINTAAALWALTFKQRHLPTRFKLSNKDIPKQPALTSKQVNLQPGNTVSAPSLAQKPHAPVSIHLSKAVPQNAAPQGLPASLQQRASQ